MYEQNQLHSSDKARFIVRFCEYMGGLSGVNN